jgi:hypothetical protein
MTRRGWYLAVALAFAVHNVEEGIGAPRLLQLMQSRAPQFLRPIYVGISPAEFRVSIALLVLIGFCLAVLAARSPTSRAWAYVMLVFGTVIGINGLGHVTFSATWREYMPGTLTAIALTIPVAFGVLVRSRREAWIRQSMRWTVLPAAIVIHGPVLAALVPVLVRVARLFTRGAA